MRSLSAMAIMLLTAPLGLVEVVSTMRVTGQPFGFNAILGLIALAGILMRNTLILMGQIRDHQREGMDPYHVVVEASVQRSRLVILTALAAVLASVPLISSVSWGSMTVTLIGTILTLIFLPALSMPCGTASGHRSPRPRPAIHERSGACVTGLAHDAPLIRGQRSDRPLRRRSPRVIDALLVL